MSKAQVERNYWPHSIIAGILFIIGACVLTIVIAVKNPVEMDTFYMEKYQKVDENINEIIALQEKFNAKFDLRYSTESFVIGQNNIAITLIDKQTNKEVGDAKVVLLLSRPETNKDNKEMKPSKIENGNYVFESIETLKPGRWQILTKIESGEFKGYSKYEVYATK